VSRAAKGADCKSAGYAFAGSSPASPTTLKIKKKIENELLEKSDFHVAYVAKYSPIISTVANWFSVACSHSIAPPRYSVGTVHDSEDLFLLFLPG
jgi:hypothetical protein